MPLDFVGFFLVFWGVNIALLFFSYHAYTSGAKPENFREEKTKKKARGNFVEKNLKVERKFFSWEIPRFFRGKILKKFIFKIA